jgi:VanZ family protein
MDTNLRLVASKKLLNILFSWITLAVYGGLIFTLSSMSNPLPAFDLIQRRHIDKVLHIIEYGIFSFLLFRALSLTCRRITAGKLVALVVVVSFVYAVSDELHQSFVPMRDASAHDAFANGVGIMLGVGAASL